MVTCDYCHKPARFRAIKAKHVMGVWECKPCGAKASADDRGRPMGRLANAELYRLRFVISSILAPQVGAKMRRDGCGWIEAQRAAWRWIADRLGMRLRDCRLEKIDAETAQRVVEILLRPQASAPQAAETAGGKVPWYSPAAEG